MIFLFLACAGSTSVSDLFQFDYCTMGSNSGYRSCYWSGNEELEEFLPVALLEDGVGDDFDLQIDEDDSIYYLAVQVNDDEGAPITELVVLDEDHQYVECGDSNCTQYAMLPTNGRFYVDAGDEGDGIVDATLSTDED